MRKYPFCVDLIQKFKSHFKTKLGTYSWVPNRCPPPLIICFRPFCKLCPKINLTIWCLPDESPSISVAEKPVAFLVNSLKAKGFYRIGFCMMATLAFNELNQNPRLMFWLSCSPVKACVRYFLSKFYFSPNNSPSKTMKNVFYFI